MSVQMKAEITIYEENGVELSFSKRKCLMVESHSYHNFVAIIIDDDGKRYTVLARDLLEAVKRCDGLP